jgi:Rrf2 family protein
MRSLSQKTKYALRALRVLAREGKDKPLQISQLAESERIPRKFLEAILLELRNKGILQSKKGKGGGYALLKRPDDISLGAIVRVFDGPLATLPCVSEIAFRKCEECEDVRTCGTRAVFKEVRDATAKVLDGTSLADLMKRDEALKAAETPAISYSI